MENIILRPPASASLVIPDDKRYKCRFEIKSETSDRIYRIAFDAAPGARYWKCSCPGNIRHGQCKHLDALNLLGRKYGANLEQAAAFSKLENKTAATEAHPVNRKRLK